jgi:hypothetical protein
MLKLFFEKLGLGLIILSLFSCDKSKLEPEQSTIQGNNQVLTNTEPKTQSNQNNQYYIIYALPITPEKVAITVF